MHSFKKILKTVGLFLLAVLSISLAFMELYFRAERDSFQDGSDRAAAAGSIDTLVCGASHAYRDVNPAVLDAALGTSSYNVSGALMTMRGRWELLHEELARNPVKTVILELSFNSMSRKRDTEGSEGDLYVMGRLQGFFHRLSFFCSAFRVSEYPEVYYKFVSEGMDTLSALLAGEPAPEAHRIRGYLPTGPRTKPLPPCDAAHYHIRHLNTRQYAENVEYLRRILDECDSRGIRVVLITTPISRAALWQYDNFDDIYEAYRALAAARGYAFYDFNLYRDKESRFPDETAFYDTLHLNPEGADAFSALLAEFLSKSPEAERFYSSYAEMEEQLAMDKSQISAMREMRRSSLPETA